METRRAADIKTKMPPLEWPMVMGKCAEVELTEQWWKGVDWVNLCQLTLGHLDLRTVMVVPAHLSCAHSANANPSVVEIFRAQQGIGPHVRPGETKGRGVGILLEES